MQYACTFSYFIYSFRLVESAINYLPTYTFADTVRERRCLHVLVHICLQSQHACSRLSIVQREPVRQYRHLQTSFWLQFPFNARRCVISEPIHKTSPENPPIHSNAHAHLAGSAGGISSKIDKIGASDTDSLLYNYIPFPLPLHSKAAAVARSLAHSFGYLITPSRVRQNLWHMNHQ